MDECASDPCEHGARCVESSMGLIISGYIEGSSNVRLIELFNPTCDSIDLGGYGVSMITNGGSLDSASTLALSGSLAGGGSFVICHSGQDVALYAGCDMRSAVLEFNGDDALALMREGQVVDVSLFEPLFRLCIPHITMFDMLGINRERVGNDFPDAAPRSLYKTSDDRWLGLSATSQSRRLWRL